MSTSVANVVSHFPSAENGFTTTTSGSVSSGAATVGLNSVAGYSNGEIAVFVIDPTDASKKQTFTGVIDTSGVQVTSVVWTAGTNQTHLAGATVVDYATATHISMVTKGLLVEHTQTGTHGAITATSINNAGTLIQTGALTLRSWDGWWDANETWTYASGAGTNVGTFTITGVDRTTKYQAGDRLKFTQTTVKYALITKVVFSTDTTVTIYMGTDYTIANAAISANSFSHVKAPFGFPLSPTKWTETLSSAVDRATTSTSFATLTDSLAVPIGAWDLYLKIAFQHNNAGANNRVALVTLSSNASTETNPETTLGNRLTAVTNHTHTATSKSFVLLTVATTFTMMAKTDGATDTVGVLGSSVSATIIKATSTYL